MCTCMVSCGQLHVGVSYRQSVTIIVLSRKAHACAHVQEHERKKLAAVEAEAASRAAAAASSAGPSAMEVDSAADGPASAAAAAPSTSGGAPVAAATTTGAPASTSAAVGPTASSATAAGGAAKPRGGAAGGAGQGSWGPNGSMLRSSTQSISRLVKNAAGIVTQVLEAGAQEVGAASWAMEQTGTIVSRDIIRWLLAVV